MSLQKRLKGQAVRQPHQRGLEASGVVEGHILHHVARRLVLEQFGRVPEAGDSFTCGDLRVQVTRVENHRIEEIRVVQETPAPAEAIV